MSRFYNIHCSDDVSSPSLSSLFFPGWSFHLPIPLFIIKVSLYLFFFSFGFERRIRCFTNLKFPAHLFRTAFFFFFFVVVPCSLLQPFFHYFHSFLISCIRFLVTFNPQVLDSFVLHTQRYSRQLLNPLHPTSCVFPFFPNFPYLFFPLPFYPPLYLPFRPSMTKYPPRKSIQLATSPHLITNILLNTPLITPSSSFPSFHFVPFLLAYDATKLITPSPLLTNLSLDAISIAFVKLMIRVIASYFFLLVFLFI